MRGTSDVANGDFSPKPNQTEKPKKSTQTKPNFLKFFTTQTKRPNQTKRDQQFQEQHKIY
jgi:hypothetical protein